MIPVRLAVPMVFLNSRECTAKHTLTAHSVKSYVGWGFGCSYPASWTQTHRFGKTFNDVQGSESEKEKKNIPDFYACQLHKR